MDVGNFFNFMPATQKKVLLSLLISIPCAYVFLNQLYEPFPLFDQTTKLAYSICLGSYFMLMSYTAQSIGVLVTGLDKLNARYIQMLAPQLGIASYSFVHPEMPIGNAFILHFAFLAVIIFVWSTMGRFVQHAPLPHKRNKRNHRKPKKHI